MALKKAIKATLTTVIDNYTHILLPINEWVERPPLSKGNVRMPPLLAEHGFSILIEVTGDSEANSILMDFGISTIGVFYNLKVLGVELGRIEAFVVSHGHPDHQSVTRFQGQPIFLMSYK